MDYNWIVAFNNRLIVQWGNYSGSGNLSITFAVSFTTLNYSGITNFRNTSSGNQISIQHVSVYNCSITRCVTRVGDAITKGIILIGY